MDEFQATYLSRRLAETRRVESLAASIRFDLARSGLDDDQLEAAVNAFAQTEPSTGWGWSTVLNDLVTREPKRVPVTDMKEFQQNLINLGYASPLTVASGTWDPSWYGAARRYDRDLQEGQMAGKIMLAAPLRQGIELLGQTMPSSIWKNVVGWAKGFVEQTPETVGRVGALGGAVSGAAIGGLVGGPVGAVAGGAIGAGIGFFGDLLQKDDEEANQSVLASVADALTPFEEYAGNSKAFFEDLGYVGTIASVIGGVKVASGLLEGSVKGITSTLANQGAADVQLGLPGTIIRGMTRRIAPGSLEAVSQGLARVSPIAHLAKYPAAGMVNGIYTGFSTASVGIHLTAGLGQGSRDVNEDLRTQAAALMRASVTEGRNLTQEEMELIDRANHGVGVGTIEKAISETGVPGELGSLNAGPQVFGMPLSDWLLPANMLDIASFFFWPQKLLPIVPGGISKTLGKLEDVPLTPGIAASYAKLDGSEHRLRPWVYALMGDGISSSEARAWAKEHINPVYDAYVRMDSGVKTLTYRQLRENVIEMSKADITFGQTYRANIAKMYTEGATGRSPTAQRAFAETVVNDNSFLAHLSETLPPGKDLRTAVIQHQEAIAEVSRLEGSMRALGVSHEFMAGPKGVGKVQIFRTPEGVVTIPYGRMTIQHDAAELQDLTVRLEAQIAQAEAAKLADGATLKDLPEMTAKYREVEGRPRRHPQAAGRRRQRERRSRVGEVPADDEPARHADPTRVVRDESPVQDPAPEARRAHQASQEGRGGHRDPGLRLTAVHGASHRTHRARGRLARERTHLRVRARLRARHQDEQAHGQLPDLAREGRGHRRRCSPGDQGLPVRARLQARADRRERHLTDRGREVDRGLRRRRLHPSAGVLRDDQDCARSPTSTSRCGSSVRRPRSVSCNRPPRRSASSGPPATST